MFMIKIEGSGSASGSGSRSIRHGSVDPDPYQNVMDPQHCENPLKKLDCGAQMGRGEGGDSEGEK